MLSQLGKILDRLYNQITTLSRKSRDEYKG